jgi:hypothetical protein
MWGLSWAGVVIVIVIVIVIPIVIVLWRTDVGSGVISIFVSEKTRLLEPG